MIKKLLKGEAATVGHKFFFSGLGMYNTEICYHSPWSDTGCPIYILFIELSAIGKVAYS